jgi:hypothetical protein
MLDGAVPAKKMRASGRCLSPSPRRAGSAAVILARVRGERIQQVDVLADHRGQLLRDHRVALVVARLGRFPPQSGSRQSTANDVVPSPRRGSLTGAKDKKVAIRING